MEKRVKKKKKKKEKSIQLNDICYRWVISFNLVHLGSSLFFPAVLHTVHVSLLLSVFLYVCLSGLIQIKMYIKKSEIPDEIDHGKMGIHFFVLPPSWKAGGHQIQNILCRLFRQNSVHGWHCSFFKTILSMEKKNMQSNYSVCKIKCIIHLKWITCIWISK